MYYIIAFTSRGETMKFSSLLTRNNIPHMIVNTPREITLSCSTSIKISRRFLDICKRLLSKFSFYTFLGVYMDRGL